MWRTQFFQGMKRKKISSSYKLFWVLRKIIIALFQCVSAILLTTERRVQKLLSEKCSYSMGLHRMKKKKFSENSFCQNNYSGKVMGRQIRFLLTFSGNRHNSDSKRITSHQSNPISTQIHIFWHFFKSILMAGILKLDLHS